MPEVAPVDPDAPSANAAEEDVMPSGRQQEVCARVQTHLQLRQANRELVELNRQREAGIAVVRDSVGY